jgi:hypothetical protein
VIIITLALSDRPTDRRHRSDSRRTVSVAFSLVSENNPTVASKSELRARQVSGPLVKRLNHLGLNSTKAVPPRDARFDPGTS